MQYFKPIMYLGLVYKIYLQSKDKVKAKILAGQLLFILVGYANNNYANGSKDKNLVIRHFFLSIVP